MKDSLLLSCSILLVEDDPETREIISTVVKMKFADATLHLAADGQVGLDLYRQHAPQIVVTDINLPVLDGIRMVGEILACDPSAQIIVVSAYSEPSYLLDAIKLGIHRYLLKPLDLKLLVESIADCLALIEIKRFERQLQESEKRYRSLFDNMINGLAFCRMLFDELGVAADFVYLGVNAAFGRLVGLEDVVGKKATELFPGIRETCPELFEIYGRVARTGQAESFDFEFPPLGRCFCISVYSTQPGHFTAVFDDITERKKAETVLKQSEEKFRALFELSPDGIGLVDLDGSLRMCNRQHAELHGYESPEEMIGRSVFDLIAPCSRQDVAETMGRLVATGEPGKRTEEFAILKKDGSVFPAEVSAALVRNFDGEPSAFIGIVRDVTERRHAEDEARQGRERLSQIVDGVSVAIFVIDATHTVTHWNRACASLTGVPADAIIGTRNQWQVFYPEQRPVMADLMVDGADEATFVRLYGEKLRRSEVIEGVFESETFFPHFGEGGTWLYCTAAMWLDSKGKVVGAIETLQDVTERKQAEEALRESQRRYYELSITDNLTGLFNSRHFFSQLQLEKERANRYDRPLSLLLLDVDNFKGYNDTYGHVEGDRVLAGLAKVIRGSLRESDSGYRYGGEEFVAILPETGCDEAMAVAERLRQAFEETPFYPMGHGEVHITVSIGVSCYRPGDELKEFIRRADQGTYQAKSQGKNRVVYRAGEGA